MYATWPAHLTLLDLIAIIIFGFEYKLCNFLQPPSLDHHVQTGSGAQSASYPTGSFLGSKVARARS
jgi:hypothetical protein